MEAVYNGLKTGLDFNPVIKYIGLGLVITFLFLKIYKWWVSFKKKV